MEPSLRQRLARGLITPLSFLNAESRQMARHVELWRIQKQITTTVPTTSDICRAMDMPQDVFRYTHPRRILGGTALACLRTVQNASYDAAALLHPYAYPEATPATDRDPA